MATEIRHIVFDVGQVLLNWNPDLIYHDLIPDPAERRNFLSNICSPAWNIEQDRGRSWSEAEDALIQKHPDHEALIRAYRTNWNRSIPSARAETVKMMDAMIEAGRDVTLLTNFSQETFPEACERFPFLLSPRGATVSGSVGLLKPDIDIYRHHEQAFDLAPELTLFIDDSANNVEGARQANWQAHHYQGEDLLRKELVLLGLLD